MIEVVAIFCQLIFFLLIFSFPFNPVVLNKILITKRYFFGVFDTLLINGVIILNLLLICSYLSFDLKYIFYFFLSFSICINIFCFNKWLKYLKLEKIYILFFLILCICIFLNLSYNLNFEWDGIAHWFFKTKLFYDGHSIENIRNLPASMYPHLGTYLWAFFWKNSIIEYEYLGRLIYIFIYVLSIFSLSCSFFKDKSFNIFILSPIILLLIIFTYDDYLLGGYQEYLLFSFMALISKLIINILDNKYTSIKQLIILILTGNLLIYFKDEGVIYLSIIFLILGFFIKNNLNKFIIILSLILSISIQFFLEKNIIQVYGFQEPIKINLDQILDIKFLIATIFLISKHVIISIIKYPIWILIFLSLFFMIPKNPNKKLLKYFYIKLIFFYCFIYGMYIIHPYTSEFLLSVTLERLLFQISGFFVFPVILFFHFFTSNKLYKKLN